MSAAECIYLPVRREPADVPPLVAAVPCSLARLIGLVWAMDVVATLSQYPGLAGGYAALVLPDSGFLLLQLTDSAAPPELQEVAEWRPGGFHRIAPASASQGCAVLESRATLRVLGDQILWRVRVQEPWTLACGYLTRAALLAALFPRAAPADRPDIFDALVTAEPDLALDLMAPGRATPPSVEQPAAAVPPVLPGYSELLPLGRRAPFPARRAMVVQDPWVPPAAAASEPAAAPDLTLLTVLQDELGLLL